MLRDKLLATLFLLFGLSFASFSQDINGKWTGKIMGQYEVVYFFEYNGETLGGKTIGPQGNEIPIKEGSVKGKNMQFVMDLMGNETTFYGKIDKNKIYLRIPVRETEVAVTLEKVEN
jgi:hypothetical protein